MSRWGSSQETTEFTFVNVDMKFYILQYKLIQTAQSHILLMFAMCPSFWHQQEIQKNFGDKA